MSIITRKMNKLTRKCPRFLMALATVLPCSLFTLTGSTASAHPAFEHTPVESRAVQPSAVEPTNSSLSQVAQGTNVEQTLSFNNDYLDAKWVMNVENYEVSDRTIISNVGVENAVIGGVYPKSLKPRTSRVVENVVITEADSLILISVKTTTDIGNVTAEWDRYTDGPHPVPLWKSTQDDVGIVNVDPYFLTQESDSERSGEQQAFQVKVNLWFATAKTNCLLHQTHATPEIVEVHTQIHGTGRVQGFYEEDFDTLYEDAILAPGETHTPFAHYEEEENRFVYPWHQYYADTDTIWMAIEFHPLEQS